MVSVLNRVRMFEHQTGDGQPQNQETQTPHQETNSGRQLEPGAIVCGIANSPQSPRKIKKRESGRSFVADPSPARTRPGNPKSVITSPPPAKDRSEQPGWQSRKGSRPDSPDQRGSESRTRSESPRTFSEAPGWPSRNGGRADSPDSVSNHDQRKSSFGAKENPRFSSPFLPGANGSKRPSPVILPQKPMSQGSVRTRSASPSLSNRDSQTRASPDPTQSPRQHSSSKSPRSQRPMPVILPQRASPTSSRPASPRWQGKDRSNGESLEQNPSTHPRVSNKGRFSTGRQTTSPVAVRSPSPSWMTRERNGSPASLKARSASPSWLNRDKNASPVSQQARSASPSWVNQGSKGKDNNFNPATVKARSASPSWVSRDNSGTESPETIPAPLTPSSKETDSRFSSPFLPPQSPKPMSQRQSPVILPSKTGSMKQLPFKHIQNQDSLAPAGALVPGGTDSVHARTKTWKPSPRGKTQQLSGELEKAFRKTRKSEPTYPVSSKKGRSGEVKWPPSSHHDSTEGDREPVALDPAPMSMDENREPAGREKIPVPDESTLLSTQPLSSGADGSKDAPLKKIAGAQVRPSRASQLMRLKAVDTSNPPSQGLKSSLVAAKVVMEEEKSNAGSSDASTRSALSNKELGDIASLALNLSKNPKQSSAKPVFLPSLKLLKAPRPAGASSSPKGRSVETSKATTDSRESKSSTKNSRAGKLSQALRRAAAHDAMRSVQDKDRSQLQETGNEGKKPSSTEHEATSSASDAVKQHNATAPSSQNTTPSKQPSRRARAIMSTSHHENRRALLSAAQKQKERGKSEKKQQKGNAESAVPTNADINSQSKSADPKHEQDRKDASEVTARLGFKASRVLAMKNSARGNRTTGKTSPPPMEDYEISTNGSVISALSVDSIKFRRTNHPAFAARAASPKPGAVAEKSFPATDLQRSNPAASEKPKVPSKKPFSEELFSSFRHFKKSQPTTPEPDNTSRFATLEPDNTTCSQGSSFDLGRATPNTVELTQTFSDTPCATPKAGSEHSRTLDGRPPQYGSISNQVELQVALTSDEDKRVEMTVTDSGKLEEPEAKSLPVAQTPGTLRDAIIARGKRATPQVEAREPASSFAETKGSIDRDSPVPTDTLESPDSSPFLEQEDSMHSTSERNYMDGFYNMGRSRFTSKQGFQEVNYLSSLSSNTFSNQSIMSMDEKRKGAIPGSAKSGDIFASPMSFTQSQSQFAFRLEPVEGTSLLGNDLPSTMSPGPSMRSGHSMAHSIISVSPRGDTPKRNSEFDYLQPSPSKRGRTDIGKIETLQENDEEDSSKISEASIAQPSKERTDAPSETTPEAAPTGAIGSLEIAGEQKRDPTDRTAGMQQARSNLLEPPEGPGEAIQKSLSYKQTIFPILSSSSALSHSGSPPGFVFTDSELEKVIPDPDGAPPDPYVIPEDLFGDCDSSTDGEDRSFGTELEAGELKVDSTLNFQSKNGKKPDDKTGKKTGDENVAKEQEGTCKDRSVSTKGTTSSISTSLRSGLSSIQNAAALTSNFVEDVFVGTGMSPANGSTSMRTGLSSIQNPNVETLEAADDINASANTRDPFSAPIDLDAIETNPDVPAADTDMESQKSSSMHHSHHISQRNTIPDTIIEEDDEASGARKSTSENSPQKSDVESIVKDTVEPAAGDPMEKAADSAEKAANWTKDGPNLFTHSVDRTATTAPTEASPGGTFMSQSVNQIEPTSSKATGKESEDTESEPSKKISLPRILTDDRESISHVAENVSVLDASYVSAGSSKQSSKWWKKKKKGLKIIKQVLAKASPRHGLAPSPAADRPQTPQNGFSSDDDDEDIFGGLEEDNTIEDGGKKRVSTPKTPKRGSTHFRKTDGKVEEKVTTTPRRAARSSTPPPTSFTSVKKPAKLTGRDSLGKPHPTKDVIEKAAAKLKKFRTRPPSPAAATNPNSLYSNDRSGTVLDESEVLEGVNSDITSSLLAGTGPSAMKRAALKAKKQASDKLLVELEKEKNKNPTLKKAVTPSKDTSSSSRTKSSRAPNKTVDTTTTVDDENETKKKKTPKSSKRKSGEGKKNKDKKDKKDKKKKKKAKTDDDSADESDTNEDSPAVGPGSIFMTFGCGFVDTWTTNVGNACHFGSKVNLQEDILGEDDVGASFGSVGSSHSQSQLTDLEKRIWSDWDRLDASVKTGNDDATAEKKEEQDKKREAARGKLLEIAGSAISSQMSMTKDDEERGASSDYSDDSGSTGSGDSSGVSGESGMTSTSSNGPGAESQSYYSGGTDSDFASNSPSSRKDPRPNTSTPILLSFSQKSLVEKFAKQLATDGVEVLKLNTRKQWQIRYFTVSKEQIALTAHEANSKSKDVAQCPNALLWLKKFNPKSGYGISNIDKNGHGGMMLVDLVDVHVSTKADMENPIPKKLMDKFKDPVLLTLDYALDGGRESRSIEFRCKDNDEAQFLCTCMRVIRDLLKREQSLRIKNSSHKRPR